MIAPAARKLFARAAFVVALALVGISGVVWALWPNYAGVRRGQADAGYLESGDCRKCHEPEYASWRATFHRTMTREAAPENVRGDFERDNVLEFDGVRAEMKREGDRYFVLLADARGKTQRLEIDRTVGSRRMQQYLTKQGDRWMRLPVAYDLQQKRWMHLNGSFFRPDGGAYTQHVAEWNSNCVFCHNVKAQPGFDWDRRTWKTEVAELGIACGACHGPAAEHAQRALSPLTRYGWHLDLASTAPTGVTNPAKIDSDRALMICAHCHGQRVPEPEERIRTILSTGDPFDAGADLRAFFRPVQADTKVGEFSFATRFWADGSPRLTAYESQALTRSKCFTAGQAGARITCISCHSMHGGDPRGQLTTEKQTNLACTQCHEAFAAPTRLAAHTRHAPNSRGSSCFECHMPRVVFGVMAAHRTHDISIPRPSETIRFAKPNACNQCHQDWSVNRALAETRRLWPKADPGEGAADSAFDVPEGLRALFAGDAVQRALTAAAMHPATEANGPLLLEALQDRYPIVRYFAANALAATHPELPKPDYLASAPVRETTLRTWYAHWPPAALGEARAARERLAAGRAEADVEVGE